MKTAQNKYRLIISSFFVITLMGCYKEWDGTITVRVENTLNDQNLKLDMAGHDTLLLQANEWVEFRGVAHSDNIKMLVMSDSDVALEVPFSNVSPQYVKNVYFSTLELQMTKKEFNSAKYEKEDPVVVLRTIQNPVGEGIAAFEFYVVKGQQ